VLLLDILSLNSAFVISNDKFYCLLAQSSITAKAFYAGDDVKPTKQAVRMAVDTKAPGQAPPDLPSLLLDGRICYIGMPLVPSVTELVISELLWLNYASPEKPIYVYINSTGACRCRLPKNYPKIEWSDFTNFLLIIVLIHD